MTKYLFLSVSHSISNFYDMDISLLWALSEVNPLTSGVGGGGGET